MEQLKMKQHCDAHVVFRSIFRMLCILVAIFNMSTVYASSKRIALVIGNSAYQESSLINPVNDARLIAKILRQLDFHVMEHLDVDQKSMKRAIQDFGDLLDEAGRETTGLFYYAGHGIQVNGENYLIPVNAAIQRERDVGIEAVHAAAVLGVLDYARTRINFVIIDACRNNPFARSFRSSHRGLARMDAPQGTLVAYATAPGDVAQDGEGKNSPYSAALSSAMQQPDLQVEQMFKMVRRRVMAETGNTQVPWESSSLTGNFYFMETEGDDVSKTPVVISQTQVDKESLFWRSIKDSKTAEDYQEYLRQFPDGTFVRLAQKRIVLSALSQPSTETVEADQKIQTTTEPTVVSVNPGKGVAAQDSTAIPESLPTVQRNEHEPNNSIGRSNITHLSSVNRGRIDPKEDTDWYMFSVKKQGALEVNVSEVAPEQDLVFRIWDGDYHTVSNWHAPLRKGAVTKGIVDLVKPGGYSLELRDNHGDASSTHPYLLSLTFQPTNDAFEPNNTFGNAAPVNPGSQWQSNILPKGDADWYRLDFVSHGELNIAVRGVAEELDISLRLWNADKRALTKWFSPLRKGGATDAVIDIPHPGSYVLEVRDGHNDSRSILPFTTTVIFKPSIDGFEPNNNFGSATSLAIGETISATILPKADSDWYRIDVDEQGELRVAITKVQENLDISFRVWDADKRTITNWFAPLKEGGDSVGTIDLPKQGSYVIEVRDGHNDARSVLPYSLRATYTPTNDRGEPNNSFGSAVPLKLGSTISGTILPRGDADWYRISTVWPGTLTVLMSESPTNLDMVMRVWNDEKRTISSWIAPLRVGGETTGKIAISGAGTYFIEVRDGRDDNRSVQPYRLRADMSN